MIESTPIEPAAEFPFVDRIKVFELECVSSKKCEATLQFGVFFDGTNNNHERDKKTFSDSNIARLFQSYPSLPKLGISSLYVPGVGTRFSEIGSEAEGWRGTGFGIGCEARVLFALLKTLEFVQLWTGARRVPFTVEQLNVLCQTSILASRNKEAVLLKMGLARGLQELGDDRGQRRIAYFRRESLKLEDALLKSPMRVRQFIVDIFGFSRGAAEARAYATWLNEFLVEKKFGGIPLEIRFIGLFDTVASAGIVEMVGSGLNNSTGGHSGWARPESLRIPVSARNCVHFVAMHELRKNFPVDSIAVNGAKPGNFHEFAYPGSHSDVGGGYSPGELGIAAGVPGPIGDEMKLSQIPLNHLIDYAAAAGVPMKRSNALSTRSHYDPFSVSPKLQADFTNFVRSNGTERRVVAELMKTYLAWRWQIRDRYHEVGHVKLAKADQNLLIGANKKLIRYAKHLLRPIPKPEPLRVVKDFVYRPRQTGMEIPTAAVTETKLDIEAGEVLRQAMNHGMPDPCIAAFFDKYVHDSYAGFCADYMEPTGYWRYRKGFQGSEKPMNADINETPPDIANLT